MKSIFFIVVCNLLLSACGKDSQFLDKTSHVSSILKGEKVSPHTELARRVVLIAQDIDLTDDGLQFFGICTGVIINRRIVLTAAHCLNQGNHSLKIIMNPNPRSSPDLNQDVYNVIDSSKNLKYEPTPFEKSLEQLRKNPDLALLYVDRDFQPVKDSDEPNFSLELDPLEHQKNASDIKLIITGFGKTSSLKDTSSIPYFELNGVLKKANIVASTVQLEKAYFSLSQKDVAGVCYGDSGGPVFINDDGRYSLIALAIGVYKIGKENFKLEPQFQQIKKNNNDCAGHGVYLNIHFYKKWILEKMIELQKSHEFSAADAVQKISFGN